MAERTPMRSGSLPAHDPTPADLEKLATYPHVVVSWVEDDGYPTSVATTVSLAQSASAFHVPQPPMVWRVKPFWE